jgi:hypothetical protein
MTPENSASPRANFELAQKCLIAIRDIADRGVRSLDPEIMGYAIQELTQVLVERTGNDERLFANRSLSSRFRTCQSCMRNWTGWMGARGTW